MQPDLDLSVDANLVLGGFSQPVPAGDVNGDGHPDLLLPAPQATYKGRTQAGVVFVLYGSASLGAIAAEQAVTTGRGFMVGGAKTEGGLGAEAQAAGDVNGDGYDDIIMIDHAPGVEGESHTTIVFGRATSGEIDLLAPPAGRTSRLAVVGDFDFARGAGDINGDGRADVVVSSIFASSVNGIELAGTSFVVYGSATPPANLDVSTLTPTTGFRIDGGASGGPGGVPRRHRRRQRRRVRRRRGRCTRRRSPRALVCGTTYILYGGRSLSGVDLGSLPANRGFRIDGDRTGDNLGSWTTLTDLDGDGYADILASAMGASFNDRDESGSVYGVYASATLADIDVHDLTIRSGFRIDGAGAASRRERQRRRLAGHHVRQSCRRVGHDHAAFGLHHGC